MTRISIPSSPVPLYLETGSVLQLSDDELFELCARNREVRIERTADGDLLVMPPKGGATGHRNAVILGALGEWSKQDGTGVGFDSTAGFLLANGAMRAPSTAWVLRSRLEPLSREAKERFIPVTPDFVVELRSAADRVPDLEAKMEEYREQGARLGWLIDPEERKIHVYRAGRPGEVLNHPAEVPGDPELPGFDLALEPIWAPL